MHVVQVSPDAETWSLYASAPTFEIHDDAEQHSERQLGHRLDLHDLGNMLQVAASAFSLLERRHRLGIDSGLEHIFSGGQEALHCAGALARRLLDHTRSTAKDRALCPVVEAMNRVAGHASSLAPLGVRIETLTTDGLTPFAYESVALDNALLNLALNAIYALEGGGTVRLGAVAVQIGEWPCVRVFVEDDGKGMDEAAMRSLFTPGASDKPQGSGLGLIGVARFARAQGGDVTVKSRLGDGTCVSMLLPSPQR